LKIALTGATGFVGRHVLRAFEDAGHRVTVLLRPDRAVPSHLQPHDVRELDFAAATPDAFERAGSPDVLLHLAWGGLSDFHAPTHFEYEAPLHYRFLRAMIAGGLRRVVATGTCLEYGLQSGALDEAADTRPVCAYGLAKDVLRRQLELVSRVKPFELRWLRLFYLYGEGQSSKALWPALCRAAAAGDRTFPMSGGEQLRDYLSVADAARQVIDLTLVERAPPIVNVCSGQPVAVRSLVESWIAANGWPIRPELGARPYADYEPMAFWGSRRRLDDALRNPDPKQRAHDQGAMQ
jgi:nucleoside-diphosphate-sugar epimerase